jgi:hypothetical protein
MATILCVTEKWYVLPGKDLERASLAWKNQERQSRLVFADRTAICCGFFWIILFLKVYLLRRPDR